MSGGVRLVCVLAAVAVLGAIAAPVPSALAQPPRTGPATPSTAQDVAALRLPSEGGAAVTDGKGGSDGAPGPKAGGKGTATGHPDCSKLKCVALTMDDGPVANTSKVLDLLRKKKVHATFFVLGQNARLHPGLVRRMLAEGHAVGNHSWNHPQFWKMSRAAIARQLDRTDALLKRITGKKPRLVRPPYGEVDARVRRIATAGGQSLVLWDVDPDDWRDHDADLVVRRVLHHARRGSIILTHDVWPTTRHAYARIIDGLEERGFTLVTVPQLLGSKAKPGRVFLRQ
ncbi:MAG: polysaccharide deacetylase family protein [Propionicimonas sp.]|uniref:polysaccharide deacetylase family protein n=1 Tax=Propionicimonas sp. TaxID=1955623 RepID=UPI003D139022